MKVKDAPTASFHRSVSAFVADYSEHSFICLVTASLIQSGLPPADNTDTTSLLTSISLTPSLLLLPSICSSTSSTTRAEMTGLKEGVRISSDRAGSRLTAAEFPRAFTQSSASGSVWRVCHVQGCHGD